MRLIILHLSDIHFRETANPISRRDKEMISAISNQTPSPDAVMIIVSGDIAFSGRSEEYAKATEFFSALETQIRGLNNKVELAFLSVPGNHDCFLPETTVALRRVLVEGIKPTIDTISPDPGILDQLLLAQESYFTFQDKVTSRPGAVDQRLCSTELIVLGGIKIQVNLYNTSLLSQREETQTLKVPVAMFDLKIRPIGDVVLTLAILHHTNLWLEANNAVQFRRHIEQNADLVLSGHQHVDHAFEKLNLDGQIALFLEGAALQDDFNPAASAFSMVEIELPERKQRVVHFDWKNNRYAAVVKRDWSPLVENRAFRHEFRISEQFQRVLDDPGAGYTHSQKRELTLRDLFVYPDLSVRRRLDKPAVAEVAAEQFHGFLRTADHVIFEGEGQSGRTSLAKMMFSDILNVLGLVPIFVDGRDLKLSSDEGFAKRITEAVKSQYVLDLVERFEDLERAKRVLIVDDWHKAKFSAQARADFLSVSTHRFGKVFLFSDPVFDFQEFATRAKDQSTILQFQHATIQQFGYRTRGHLIKKWLTLGRERTHDVKELTREIDEIENIVTTLLGKNTLPKFPFIVLSVLQAYQEKKTTTAEAGSYGYVYEVLITTALTSTAKSPSDIDKKYTFLAHLAYWMFKSGVDALSYSEIVKVSERYFHAYGLPVTPDSMLNDLIGARVLLVRDGNYRFHYSYYCEYFVARYYKDALQNRDEKAAELAGELSDMATHVSWEQYSKILMFFLYFTRDPDLIALLISNANEVFGEFPPATLDRDIEFTNALYREPSIAELPPGDVHEHREARNEERDKFEKSAAGPAEGKRIKYSEALEIEDKLDIANRYLELLGQILRNFPGSLKLESGVNFSVSLQICRKMGVRTQKVCSSRSIFSNAACASFVSPLSPPAVLTCECDVACAPPTS